MSPSVCLQQVLNWVAKGRENVAGCLTHDWSHRAIESQSRPSRPIMLTAGLSSVRSNSQAMRHWSRWHPLVSVPQALEGMLIACNSVTRNAPTWGVLNAGLVFASSAKSCYPHLVLAVPSSFCRLARSAPGPTRHLASDDYPGCEALMHNGGHILPSIYSQPPLTAFLPHRPWANRAVLFLSEASYLP